MSNRLTYIIAGVLLLVMLITAFTSSLGDSTTMDELSHIPAGFSYLSQKDFRINPEHPPLVKDLAALPLLRLDLNFPKDHPSWQENVNDQWWFGPEFLYRSGNDADQILFWARIPMILLLIFLGWFLFLWTKKLAGNITALLVLILFSFSPTFLAHGRLVTTDVAAALGVVLSTYFWLKFLEKPSKKNIILAGLILGISMLFKFSLILLVPFFAIITIVKVFLKFKSQGVKKLFRGILKYAIFAVIIGMIGIIFIIWPVYQFHVLDYPIERQTSDTESILSSFSLVPLKDLCIWMIQKPILRPLTHYLLGLLMVFQRTAGGNTTYFMGIVSNVGWWYYFPIVYFLKVPLALHILSLIALFWAVSLIKKPFWQKPWFRITEWVKNHFSEFSMMVFLVIYWTTSIAGNLNIGLRHVLPTFPFIYILVSLGIFNLLKKIKKIPLKKMANSFISVLLGFYIVSSLLAWPHYLSYFNEIAGGSEEGYKYVVDSNYDWGQDLKRLKNWVEKNNIEEIYVDYFGGGNAEYYLKEKYRSWNGNNKPQNFPKGNYLAVSVTLLQGGRGNAAPGFDQPTGFYLWLNNYEPETKIGSSIFVYYIE